jgi:hypothetical protein
MLWRLGWKDSPYEEKVNPSAWGGWTRVKKISKKNWRMRKRYLRISEKIFRKYKGNLSKF